MTATIPLFGPAGAPMPVHTVDGWHPAASAGPTWRYGGGYANQPWRRATAIAALLALGLASGLAQAAPLTVANPGFEADSITPGAFVVLQPQAWLPYDPNVLLVAQPGLNAVGAIRPLPGTEYFPGGTPEGNNAALVFLAGDGSGEAGLQQMLSATLQAGQRYTLRVDVGNIASGTSLAGSSGGAGVFFNLNGLPGYRLDLMAGASVLASDVNSIGGTIPEGQFRTATLGFDAGAAAPALIGQALGIRLVNLKQPGTLASPNIEVDFDNVRLDVSPVPEPSTLALWLGGTLLIGGAVARSRQRAAATR